MEEGQREGGTQEGEHGVREGGRAERKGNEGGR